MEVVKIKNLNKSYMNKPFIVKGRVKYTKLENNRNLNVKYLNSIIFDDSSEIQVIAYEHYDKISKQIKNGNVVKIKNGKLIYNKNNKTTKHKYIIMLESHSIITTINKDEVNNDDFPIHKYTSGAALKTLIPGMIIDVNGILVQLDSESSANNQFQIFRKGIIKVDSTEIEVRFHGKKAEKLYNVGNKLFLSKVKYIYLQGCEYLSVLPSSHIRCRQNQQLRHVPADLKGKTQDFNVEEIKKIEIHPIIQDLLFSNSLSPSQRKSEPKKSKSDWQPFQTNFTIGSPDQNQWTSGSTPCNKNSTIVSSDNKVSNSIPSSSNNSFTIGSSDNRVSNSIPFSSNNNFTIGSPDQKQSTSGSTPCNKRKSQDFNVKEVTSKILKLDEPKESFSDEKFTKVVLNLLKNIKNNKEVVKLRIIEFISEIIPENDT